MDIWRSKHLVLPHIDDDRQEIHLLSSSFDASYTIGLGLELPF